ncbi:MAG TPA: D-alanine--D-alanine ligase [Hyphomicrobiaceae bacterium]|jgi:D-alanine-D-alanine ligase|nr:D-alanine--D-alanine ligase [Hyphomicrobiaceae bacterium]
MTTAAARTLRILLLTDEGLVPDRPRNELNGREAELRKTEYDVISGLERLGHEVAFAGVGGELSVIRQAIEDKKPHIAFNLVEQFDNIPFFDQHVVSYLELKKQKYTGCNPRGLTLARDKALTKKILAYHRIAVPRFAVFPPRKKIVVPTRLSFPLFVKSLTEEGSEGISQASLVRDPDKLIERVGFIHEKTNAPALVEEFIEGREIYVGLFGNELLTALPPWELTISRKDAPVIATDKAKWDPQYQKKIGLKTGPAKLDQAMIRKIERTSKRIYRLLNLSGYARLDYRLSEGNRLYLLEANPNPQIARNEDFADSAEHAGMKYEELLQKLVTLGLSYQPRP